MTRKMTSDERNHGLSKKEVRDRSLNAQDDAERAMGAGYPRLLKELRGEETPVNFLRITMGRSGDYYAAFGVWDSQDTPMVMFGSGRTPLDALWALERAMVGGHWRLDLWEQEKLTRSGG